MEATKVLKKKKTLVPKLSFMGVDSTWQNMRYGDIYAFYTTNSFSRDNLNYQSGAVKNIHYGDIHKRFATLFDIQKEVVPFVNSEIEIKKIKEESYCQEKDLVIADASEDYADIGKTIELVNLNNEKVIAGLHTFLARPNKHEMAKGFAGYLVQSWNFRKQVMIIAQGTKVLSLSTNRLANLKLTIPTLPEQKKIAFFLSAVDEKIQQLTRKKQLLEQYKKGVMQQLFTGKLRFKDENGKEFPEWEEKRFKDYVIDYRLGGNYKNTEEVTMYPLIKMGNLDRGKIKIDKLEYIPINQPIDSKDEIKYGDLFFNTRNTLDLVGKVAIWRNELPKAYYNSNLMYLMFENNFFMNYRLNSFEGVKALKRFATGTTSVAAIYTKDLIKLELLIPCFEEQKKIANYLTNIDTKIESVTKQITQTQTFKKGLLQQMFV